MEEGNEQQEKKGQKRKRENNNNDGQSKKGRNWVFTWNNPGQQEWIGWDSFKHLKYGVCQLEIGKEKGTPHFQGYLEFSQAIKRTAIAKVLDKAWIEVRQGTQEQARDYAMKSDTRLAGPWEFGTYTPNKPGKRTDLEGCAQLCMEYKTLKDIAQEYPGTFIRYSKGIKELHALFAPKKDWITRWEVRCGPPGTGKTEAAKAKYPGAYLKPPGINWWHDYQGEEVVIMDEFSGWIPGCVLLQLHDPTVQKVETKFGWMPFLAKTLVLISNKAPHEWYDYDHVGVKLEAVTRRCDEIYLHEKDKEPMLYTDWDQFRERWDYHVYR